MLFFITWERMTLNLGRSFSEARIHLLRMDLFNHKHVHSTLRNSNAPNSALINMQAYAFRNNITIKNIRRTSGVINFVFFRTDAGLFSRLVYEK
jgi:hypothetical protein